MKIKNPLNIARNAMPAVEQASENMMNSAEKGLDKAESKFREIRGSIDPMVEILASKAQSMARQSLDMASEARDRAEKSLKQAANSTTQYVAEQPMRSVLIAAAIGAAVALLVSTSRQWTPNRNRY